MSQQHVEVATDSIVYASRPVPEREIAQQVRFLIDHMLGDGFSVIDPNARIFRMRASGLSRQPRSYADGSRTIP